MTQEALRLTTDETSSYYRVAVDPEDRSYSRAPPLSPRSPQRPVEPTVVAALSRQTEALLIEPSRQNELLAALSAATLREGRFELAFMLADRRCRRPAPRAQDFLLRAFALRRLGYDDAASQDLARAFSIDPTDELVACAVLRWGPQSLRGIAASNCIAGGSEDREVLALAFREMHSARIPIAFNLQARRGMYEGWVAWADSCVPELRIRRGDVVSCFTLDADPSHPLCGHGWSAAEIAIETESPRLESVSFCLNGKLLSSSSPVRISAGRSERTTLSRRIASSRAAPNHVDIIVPVYEDYLATKACLESLQTEGSKIAKRVIVVDDCTPNDRLRSLLEEGAARGLFTLLTSNENLGFARSVNLALAQRQDGDVLLLNSDTLLPRGVIDRLAAAAYSQPGVGTVTPLSNNGELTSFPVPNTANPLGALDEIEAVDDVAKVVNGQEIVELPAGIGFCLYISRACADAVGPFCELYSRGYYEDVEFCLKARDLGFRNVCATGVFVGHAGAKSFLEEKRALVVRNLAVLEARFPEHRLQCAAFLKADPLAEARARIEENLAPKGAVALLVAPATSARALVVERARQIQSTGAAVDCLLCEFSEAGSRATLRNLGNSVPQSLAFSIAERSGLARLESYLARLRCEAIEVFDPQSLPDEALGILLGLRAPLRIALADLRWILSERLDLDKLCSDAERRGGCHRCASSPRPTRAAAAVVGKAEGSRIRELWRRAESIIAVDRMASSFCAVYLKPLVPSLPIHGPPERSIASTPRPEKLTLGIVCPEATGETDRQITTLGRMFRMREIDASIVVLGQCVDDLGVMASGNAFVTGAIERDDYPQVVQHYRIARLFSPYRTRHFGMVDDLGARCGLGKGYFDWSFGSLEVDEGDLALDPRICVERAALEVGQWLLGEPLETLRP